MRNHSPSDPFDLASFDHILRYPEAPTTEGVAKCKSRMALKDVSSGRTLTEVWLVDTAAISKADIEIVTCAAMKGFRVPQLNQLVETVDVQGRQGVMMGHVCRAVL